MQAKKILIVEDNPDMRAILSLRFKLSGYSVVEASDGEEAIAKTKEENPKLIVLDLMIPKIDGFEVCRILKSNNDYKNIPIIVLSALDQYEDKNTAALAGADCYFTKPFDIEALLKRIDNLIK